MFIKYYSYEISLALNYSKKIKHHITHTQTNALRARKCIDNNNSKNEKKTNERNQTKIALHLSKKLAQLNNKTTSQQSTMSQE